MECKLCQAMFYFAKIYKTDFMFILFFIFAVGNGFVMVETFKTRKQNATIRVVSCIYYHLQN